MESGGASNFWGKRLGSSKDLGVEVGRDESSSNVFNVVVTTFVQISLGAIAATHEDNYF